MLRISWEDLAKLLVSSQVSRLPVCSLTIAELTRMVDLLHSYLGLATLALYDESGLKEFDPTFCFSKDAVEKLKRH